MSGIPFRIATVFAILLLSLGLPGRMSAQIKLEAVNGDGDVTFYAENPMPVPMTVWLELDLRNMKPAEKMPECFVIPAESRTAIVRLLPSGSGGHGYMFQYSSAIGDVLHASHDDTTTYMLPYPSGQRFMMSQGPGGRISHKGLSAYDFPMPLKSVVTAARGGTVVFIKADSDSGCDSRDCMELANRIMVLHADGSIGTYTHLSKKGSLVKMGQVVKAGEPIGLSGNTGWSSGPHLHFEVTLPTAGGEIGVGELIFRTGKEEAQILQEGQWYKAP